MFIYWCVTGVFPFLSLPGYQSPRPSHTLSLPSPSRLFPALVQVTRGKGRVKQARERRDGWWACLLCPIPFPYPRASFACHVASQDIGFYMSSGMIWFTGPHDVENNRFLVFYASFYLALLLPARAREGNIQINSIDL